eukprot:TRINITY_DN24091_c0_g1_i1.p1 TRINITY_DN24091_c0_g1~~TRINITY_DN24091_c0_g1_i1.p1  ORF type:complete len:2019 (+),score=563.30 TRINITY_DN24091_c0_g1_i1:69-6059(+)
MQGPSSQVASMAKIPLEYEVGGGIGDPLLVDATKLRGQLQTDALRDRFRHHPRIGGELRVSPAEEAVSNFLKIMKCIETGEEEPKQRDNHTRESVGAVLDQYRLVAVDRPELRMQTRLALTGNRTRSPSEQGSPERPKDRGTQNLERRNSKLQHRRKQTKPKDDRLTREEMIAISKDARMDIERVSSAPPHDSRPFHGPDVVDMRIRLKRHIGELVDQLKGHMDTPEVRAMRRQVVDLEKRIDNQQTIIRGLKDRVEADPSTPAVYNPTKHFAGMELASFPGGPPPASSCWLVYCDVWQSTAVQSELGLQSNVPVGEAWDDVVWKTSIATFNRALAEQAIDLAAYPVRLDGDASVWAFPTAEMAALWCCHTHERLNSAVWPEQLGTIPAARYEAGRDGAAPVWSGLRARMGLHGGSVQADNDPFTGRMMYYGPLSVQAARLLHSARGGETLLSAEAKDDIEIESTTDGLRDAVWEKVTLHGKAAPREAWRLLPAGLAARQPELTRPAAGPGSPSLRKGDQGPSWRADAADGSPLCRSGQSFSLRSPASTTSPAASEKSRRRGRAKTVKPNAGADDALTRGDSVGMPLDWRPPELDRKQPWPPEGTVTVVHIQIERFQEIVTADEPGAAAALRTFVNEVRRTLKERRGYESRVEGSVYIAVFPNAIDAVSFSLDLQRSLPLCDWPDSVLTHPAGRTVVAGGVALLRGPRVQIGAHTCATHSRADPLTGRQHYLAPEVAFAAAASSVALGGETVVTDAVAGSLRSLPANMHKKLLKPTVTFVRPVSVHGVAGEISCHQLLNDHTRARAFYFGRDMGRAARQRERGDAERELALQQRRTRALELQLQDATDRIQGLTKLLSEAETRQQHAGEVASAPRRSLDSLAESPMQSPADSGVVPGEKQAPRLTLPANILDVDLFAEAQTAEASVRAFGMPAPPVSGTVHFVMASVAGAERLRGSRPEAAEKALAIVADAVQCLATVHKGSIIRMHQRTAAYLLCFRTASSAAKWASALQSDMHAVEWPSEIHTCIDSLQQPGVFNGARVRVGIHAAPLEPEEGASAAAVVDAISGSVMYRGHALSVTAAIHRRARGGEVLVSNELSAALSGDPPPEFAGGTVMCGSVACYAQQVEVRRLTPPGLESRVEVFEEYEDSDDDDEPARKEPEGFSEGFCVAVYVRVDREAEVRNLPGAASALDKVTRALMQVAADQSGLPAQRLPSVVASGGPSDGGSLWVFPDVPQAISFACKVQTELLQPALTSAWPNPAGAGWEHIQVEGETVFWGPRVCIGVHEIFDATRCSERTPFSSEWVHCSGGLRAAVMLGKAARGGEVLVSAHTARSAQGRGVETFIEPGFGQIRTSVVVDADPAEVVRLYPAALRARVELLKRVHPPNPVPRLTPSAADSVRRSGAEASIRHQIRMSARETRPQSPRLRVAPQAHSRLARRVRELQQQQKAHDDSLQIIEQSLMLAEDRYFQKECAAGEVAAPTLLQISCDAADTARRGRGGCARRLCGEYGKALVIDTKETRRQKGLQRKGSMSDRPLSRRNSERLRPGSPRSPVSERSERSQISSQQYSPVGERAGQKWHVARSAIRAAVRFSHAARLPHLLRVPSDVSTANVAQDLPKQLEAATRRVADLSAELEQERRRRAEDAGELRNVHRALRSFVSLLRDFGDPFADEAAPSVSEDEFGTRFMRQIRMIAPDGYLRSELPSRNSGGLSKSRSVRKAKSKDEMSELSRTALDEQKEEQLALYPHKIAKSAVGHCCSLFFYLSKLLVSVLKRPPPPPPAPSPERRRSRAQSVAAKVRGIVRLSRGSVTGSGRRVSLGAPSHTKPPTSPYQVSTADSDEAPFSSAPTQSPRADPVAASPAIEFQPGSPFAEARDESGFPTAPGATPAVEDGRRQRGSDAGRLHPLMDMRQTSASSGFGADVQSVASPTHSHQGDSPSIDPLAHPTPPHSARNSISDASAAPRERRRRSKSRRQSSKHQSSSSGLPAITRRPGA